jgi:hypothetical protein
MSYRRAVPFFVSLGLCACGGSGDGGGGGGSTPVNLVTFQAASAIIGQSTTTGNVPNDGAGVGNPNQSGLHLPTGHVANGSLYVPDGAQNRILGFDQIPSGLGQNADFVLGQSTFTTATFGTSAVALNLPASSWAASNALFVADAINNRVLIYSPAPTTSGAAANFALGQADLTSAVAGTGSAGLQAPNDVCVAANRIVVADTTNNRVLVWNGIPAANGAPAQIVVGQPDFVTTSAGVTAAKMNVPFGVWTDGIRLAVADTANDRVLIWTTFPTSNGQPADIVVGQPDFTTGTSGTGAFKMNNPVSVCSDGSQLFVADAVNNRVLIYSPFPTASNPAAVRVLGQSNFTNVAANDDDQNGVSDASPTARTMFTPSGVTTIGNQLFVPDQNNNRVLVFTGS